MKSMINLKEYTMTYSNMKLLRNILLLLCLPFSLSGQNAHMVIDSVKGVFKDALYIEHADDRGVRVQSSVGSGFFVGSSGGSGYFVNSAVGSGVFVSSAGDSGVNVRSTTGDGFQVGNAGENGVYVGDAVGDGFQVDNAGDNGVEVNNAGGDGIYVDNTTGYGMNIRGSKPSSGLISSHIAQIYNNSSSGTNVLSLKAGTNSPDSDTNFITFSERSNNRIGAIQGNGSGGVSLTSRDDFNLQSNSLILEPNVGDDAVISSNPSDSGGDLFLESNDAVIVRIDNNNNGSGNFFVYDDDGTNLFQVTQAGNVLVKGSSVHTSDKNQKEDITDLNYSTVLQAVLEMPIYEWQYNWEDRRHIGPMAQDFHEAFGLGEDDKTIASIDADGVALAAIKALHQQNNSQQSEINELKKEIKSKDTEMQSTVKELKKEIDLLKEILLNKG